MFIPDEIPVSVSSDDGEICIDWEMGDVHYTMEIWKDKIETTKFVNGKVVEEREFIVRANDGSVEYL